MFIALSVLGIAISALINLIGCFFICKLINYIGEKYNDDGIPDR